MWTRLSLAQSAITRLCCYFCCPLPGSKNHVIMWRFLLLYFHVSLLLSVATFTSRKHQHLQRAFCCGLFGARLRHGWRWALAFAVGQSRWNERAVTGRWDLPTADQTTEWVKPDPEWQRLCLKAYWAVYLHSIFWHRKQIRTHDFIQFSSTGAFKRFCVMMPTRACCLGRQWTI